MNLRPFLLIPALPLVAQIQNPHPPRGIWPDIQSLRNLVASWGDGNGSIQVLDHNGVQVVVAQRPMDKKSPLGHVSVFVKRSYGWVAGLQTSIPGAKFLKVEQDGDLVHIKNLAGDHEIIQFSITGLY